MARCPKTGKFIRSQPILTNRLPQWIIDWGLLILTAIVLHYLWPWRNLFLLIGLCILAWKFWFWLMYRFPHVSWFLVGLLRGLFRK